ncbi:MAG: histidine phosphatase family protein [Polyangiaceae bacterium]
MHHDEMRRRVVLLRHGESGWDGDPPSDHERVLTDHGRWEAARIGEALVAAGWKPERVVCSTASRARETAETAAPEATTSHHSSLYMGGLHAIAEAVGELDDGVGIVWVVGHNPSLSGAASALCGESVSLATANAACLEVDADSWEEALSLTGAFELRELLTPR